MQNKTLTLIYLICSLTFFSMFYPEYLFLPDAYEYVGESENEEEPKELDFSFFWQNSNQKVTVKSKFWTMLMEALQAEGNDICQQNQDSWNKQNIARTEEPRQSVYSTREWED